MKRVFTLIGFGLIMVIIAACGETTLTPTPTPANSGAKFSVGTVVPPSIAQTFTPQTNEGGGVTVIITPQSLVGGQPAVFKVVMDTHSVDLKDDMVKASLLRDDTGKQYQPIAWDGAGPGGHHREGSLKFEPLLGQPKVIELVIKGIAGVPERVFKWEWTN